MRVRSWLPIATLFLSVPASTPAQEPGSELTVYLMTVGPGDYVWEKFGHNAIWLRDAAQGTDLAYNYGLFDNDEPGFYGRFLRGRMMYWMEPLSGPGSAQFYAQSNRTVWLQELNLTPAQRTELRDFLEWNAREENKFYRYDYYHDNCSTRVRDALDRALGGQLRDALGSTLVDATYRSHSLRLTAHEQAVFTGLLLGLGPSTDHQLTAWEEGFIPMELMEHVRQVRVAGPGGESFPLVKSEQVLFEAARDPPPAEAPNRTLGYLLTGVFFGAALVLLARAGRAGSRAAAGGWLATTLLWALLAGFFGSILAALWAFTDHTVAYGNENLFQLNPLSLVLALVLPFAGDRARLRRAAYLVALGVAAVSVLGLIAQLLPGLDQTNGGIIALALPVHLAVLWTVRRGWRPVRLSTRVDAKPTAKRSAAVKPAGKAA